MKAAPTPRLALLIALAGLPLLVPGWAWLALALNLAVLAVAGAALALARRRIEAVRVCEPVLSLGAENAIRLRLRVAGPPLAVECREDLPLHFELAGEWPRPILGGGQWQEAVLRVRPTRRGAHALGPLHLRHASPLGLWRRQQVGVGPLPVRVYPNLLAVSQWEIAMRRGLQLEGLKRVRRRGQGTEFDTMREYQPGDQYRAINWPATARQGKLVTTLYQVDRAQPVLLLIDAGRMMIPQMQGLSRLDHALNAALLLATVAAERGDHCGLMLFGGEVKAFMPPRQGRAQVLAMMEALYAVEPEQVEPDYGRMIGWLRAKHKKRSLMVLFTDLMDPDISRGLIRHVGALAAHHLVLLVCLSDPELLRLSRVEPVSAREVYDQAVALEVLAQREETRAHLQRRGVLVVDVPPAEFSTAVLNQYLAIKEQGRL